MINNKLLLVALLFITASASAVLVPDSNSLWRGFSNSLITVHYLGADSSGAPIGDFWSGQGFNVSTTKTICNASLLMVATHSGNGITNLSLEIWSGNSNKPLTYIGGGINTTQIVYGNVWNNVSFNTSITVNPGTQYWLVARDPSATASQMSTFGIDDTVVNGQWSITITGFSGTWYNQPVNYNETIAYAYCAPPSPDVNVSIVSPTNTTYNTSYVNTNYSNNLDSNCTTYLNGTYYNSTLASANVSYYDNLTTLGDGPYSYNVTCFEVTNTSNIDSEIIYFSVLTVIPSPTLTIALTTPLNTTYSLPVIDTEFSVNFNANCSRYIDGIFIISDFALASIVYGDVLTPMVSGQHYYNVTCDNTTDWTTTEVYFTFFNSSFVGHCCNGGQCCAVPGSYSGCPGGQICSADYNCSQVANGQACTANSSCLSGYCNNGYCCNTGTCCSTLNATSCSSGLTCSFLNSNCTESVSGHVCTGNSDCISGYCNSGYCCGSGTCCPTPGNQSTCAADYICTATYNCTPYYPSGHVCAASSECATGYCDSGYCCLAGDCCPTPGAATGCPAGTICNSYYQCTGNTPAGDACTSSWECISGYCNNGYCCNGGTCCPTPGSGTACAAGYECSTSYNCIGNTTEGGSCTVASQCMSGYCNNGYCCDSGTCCPTPGVSTGCLTGQICSTSHQCNANTGNGGVCTNSTECTSGYCNSGRCCNSGTCCATPGSTIGCPASYMCYTSYSCITQNPYCVGITPNTCMSPQPYYCDTYLQVSNNCATCGCPSGQNCRGDGTCSGNFFDTDNIMNIDVWANGLKWFAIFAAVVLFFVGVVRYASKWND